jgi:dynein heavy chain
MALADLPGFERLPGDVEVTSRRWVEWIVHERPEQERFPGEWRYLSEFDRLLLVRAIRPDRVLTAARRYIVKVMGPAYDESSPTVLQDLVKESTAAMPILFLQTQGNDVTKDVEQLAKKMGITMPINRLHILGMAEGQDEVAEQELKKCHQRGGWVLLLNVHLMTKWLLQLEAWFSPFHY